MRLPRDRHRPRSVVLAERTYQATKRAIERMEFYIDTAGEHRWRIKAANGEILGASSEGFKRWRDAANNACLLAVAMAPWTAHYAHSLHECDECGKEDAETANGSDFCLEHSK